MVEKKEIKMLTLSQMEEEMLICNEKKFRGKQIYEWLHKKNVRSIDEMTNISHGLKMHLKENYTCTMIDLVEVQCSKEDGTRKYLLALADGNYIESVWMKYKHGNTVCISSQVGCRMGCKFCASTLGGLTRNLTAAEMLDQIYAITQDTKERVSNIVVMGVGEPLDNYEALLKFILFITDPNGLNISQRNITVSTCGLVPQMIQLADEKLQITLALSLHSTTDEKRKKMMPIANQHTIAELINACQYYVNKTGRRITFEYALAKGINDSVEDAQKLSLLAKEVLCHINLIPINPVLEREFVQSNYASILAFKNRLEKNKVNVTIRREMGRDIDGACGQLRKRHLTK